MTKYEKAARKVLNAAITEERSFTSSELVKYARVKDRDRLVETAKRLAETEFGVLWAFDPGPQYNTAKGRFIVVPDNDCNVRARVVQWNPEHVAKSVGGLKMFPRVLRATGELTSAQADRIIGTIERASDDLVLAGTEMAEAVRAKARVAP